MRDAVPTNTTTTPTGVQIGPPAAAGCIDTSDDFFDRPTEKVPPSRRPAREVVFELRSDDAHEASVAGDFTQWEKDPIKMRRSGNGVWQASAVLAPGRHLYRFLVDGQWKDDPHAEHCRNAQGAFDNVVVV